MPLAISAIVPPVTILSTRHATARTDAHALVLYLALRAVLDALPRIQFIFTGIRRRYIAKPRLNSRGFYEGQLGSEGGVFRTLK